MNNTIIIDTNVLIDYLRGIFEAKNSLKQLEQESSVAISVITKMELIIGCGNKAELQSIERFLSRFQLIELNKYISKSVTKLLNLYHLSHGLLIADALIAATAIQLDLPLFSKNQGDYRFIKGLKLLPYPYHISILFNNKKDNETP